MTTISELLNWAKAYLEHSESPLLDAKMLISYVLKVDKTYLYTWPEKAVSAHQEKQISALVKERQSGKPIAYIIGYQEFWSMPFKVTEHTLIPRADTETLVSTLLATLDNQSYQVLELGTGTGAIACALAKERNRWQITATDTSDKALEVANYNIQNLGLNHITLLQSDWFESIPLQRFDAIVSNPPYVEEMSPYLQGDIKFEPRLALVSGKDGLNDIKIITQQSTQYLKNGGMLLLEHGSEQAEAIAKLLAASGYHDIQTHRDLAGHIRASSAKVK